MKSIFVVFLVWDITFNDSDEGQCYAGDGRKPIVAFEEKEKAQSFVDQLYWPMLEANKETIVFPVQQGNAALKKALGFTLNDIDQDGRDFKLIVEGVELR